MVKGSPLLNQNGDLFGASYRPGAEPKEGKLVVPTETWSNLDAIIATICLTYTTTKSKKHIA